MSSKPGDISRQNLENHGVYYVEDVYFDRPISLQDHVDCVREKLLHFDALIPDDWREQLEDECRDYKSREFAPPSNLLPTDAAYFKPRKHELRNPSEKLMQADSRLTSACKVAEAACKLMTEPETGWKHFWRTEIFQRFISGDDPQRADEDFFDQWALCEDSTWNAFPKLQTSAPHLTRRTNPKPDLTYAFPILDSTSDLPKGLTRDQVTQLMSVKTLAYLQKKGLICSPTTGLNRWMEGKDNTLTASDLSFFPWAVVEMKKRAKVPDTKIERCYCQAANAAGAALTIREEFVNKLPVTRASIPPVIAFTCTGPKVKVWLMYRDTQATGETCQRMICIWSTTLELTWGVMAVRTIVKNMHTWASRALKFLVLNWIDRASETLQSPLIGNPNCATARLPRKKPQNSGALALSTSTKSITFEDSLRILEKALRLCDMSSSSFLVTSLVPYQRSTRPAPCLIKSEDPPLLVFDSRDPGPDAHNSHGSLDCLVATSPSKVLELAKFPCNCLHPVFSYEVEYQDTMQAFNDVYDLLGAFRSGYPNLVELISNSIVIIASSLDSDCTPSSTIEGQNLRIPRKDAFPLLKDLIDTINRKTTLWRKMLKERTPVLNITNLVLDSCSSCCGVCSSFRTDLLWIRETVVELDSCYDSLSEVKKCLSEVIMTMDAAALEYSTL